MTRRDVSGALGRDVRLVNVLLGSVAAVAKLCKAVSTVAKSLRLWRAQQWQSLAGSPWSCTLDKGAERGRDANGSTALCDFVGLKQVTRLAKASAGTPVAGTTRCIQAHPDYMYVEFF